MVPGSTLIYGSSLTMLILSPRASRMAPRDADAMPLPSEETTPPVTKTNRVMMGTAEKLSARAQLYRAMQTKPVGNNENSTGIQVSRSRRLRQSETAAP